MIRITVEIDAPAEAAQGVKEKLAMDLERFGGVRVVRVEAVAPEQLQIGGQAE